MVVRTLMFVCVLVGTIGAAETADADKAIFGYLENARLYPGAFPIEAKLDTGADHSSVNARIEKRWQKGGRSWISFVVENKAGATLRLEAPVVRTTRVRRHAGEAQERLVVHLEICLGSVRREVEVNLVDRDKFSYKLLIGRSFLSGYALVDSAGSFTTEPACR